jgi:Fic family protein
VVRLLTYALMIKYGFNVKAGERVLNPTAVFCSDRDHYYAMLAQADTGTLSDLEQWSTYVLRGVLAELKKVDQLTRYDFLAKQILFPALGYAKARALISAQEESVLSVAIQQGVVKAGDLSRAMPALNTTQRTYQIKRLVERKMLQPTKPNARQYTIGFDNSYLMRGVIHALSNEGFISAQLKGAA